MCGIAGIVDFKAQPQKQDISKMLLAIKYRGPDSTGYFLDQSVALGINRLSVIDLKTGDQPIYNEDKSIVVVFNGEIYNFSKLKITLTSRGHKFKTKSDTEVLVHLYEEKGADMCKELSGMFAFAIWDARKKRLFLGRDQSGIKPLYYYLDRDLCVFASELKALHKHPKIGKKVNPEAISSYLVLGYIPGNLTIYSNVKKLLPGQQLSFSRQGSTIQKYWQVPINKNVEKPNLGLLDRLLGQSVESQTTADVPWGVFLSGGLDSSLITYYLSKKHHNLSTFSIGFAQEEFDESPYASDVANFFKTNHHNFKYDAATLLAQFDEIVSKLDEPLADPSLFPTFHLSKMARQHVTVALSGDGGDELFGGYPTFRGEYFAKWFQMLPASFDKFLNKFSLLFPFDFGSYSKKEVYGLFFSSLRLPNLARRLYWTSQVTGNTPQKLWMSQLRLFDWYKQLENETDNPKLSFSQQFQQLLFKTYLPDDLLVKTDRASMYNSLEVRVPFLDTKLIEYAFNSSGHVDFSETKKQLRSLAASKLPLQIVSRQKKGFGIPLRKWSTGELKDLIEQYLQGRRLTDYVEAKVVQKTWQSHLSEQTDSSRFIWALVMLSAWLKNWR